MIAPVWAKHGLKPQRLDRYMATNDPDFETKAADIRSTLRDLAMLSDLFQLSTRRLRFLETHWRRDDPI